MPRTDPDNIRRGPTLDKLRSHHPAFVAERLKFCSDLSVSRSNVATAYGDWLGRNWQSNDMHNVYALIRFLGAVENEESRTFHGVGLRD
ncbi:MAG: hypothetical protein OXO50_00485 [Caldilineaceae bacterium]|nr:hypothetical protein [Caldilineaceae bacterium]